MTTPRLAIIGEGKMGRAVGQLADERGWPVVARITRGENSGGKAITPDRLSGADVAIEFTAPRAAADNVRACLRAGCPVVTGTTGWSEALPEVEREVRDGGGAMLWAPNFSIGVNILWSLSELAARLAGSAGVFDAHIVETHHAAKRDAPSGTALELQGVASGAFGRAIPITSVRVGSVPGTHELVLDSAYEQLRIEHVARDRRVFAEGALAAARWLVGRSGVFTMRDVLSARVENDDE